jgi:hypothetical protein
MEAESVGCRLRQRPECIHGFGRKRQLQSAPLHVHHRRESVATGESGDRTTLTLERHLIRTTELSPAGCPSLHFGCAQQGGAHTLTLVSQWHPNIGVRHVKVLPMMQLEIEHADHDTSVPSHKTAVFLRTVSLAGHGQALLAQPAETGGPAFQVGEVEDLEPCIEGLVVEGIYPHDIHGPTLPP